VVFSSLSSGVQPIGNKTKQIITKEYIIFLIKTFSLGATLQITLSTYELYHYEKN
jgi:hypothetical protein